MKVGQVKTASGKSADCTTHREDQFVIDALEEVYNYAILKEIKYDSFDGLKLMEAEHYPMLILPFPLAWALYCPKGHTGNRPELELETAVAKQVN